MVRVCVDGQSWHSVVVVVDEPVAAPLDAVVAGLAAAEQVEVEVGMVVVAVHSVVDAHSVEVMIVVDGVGDLAVAEIAVDSDSDSDCADAVVVMVAASALDVEAESVGIEHVVVVGTKQNVKQYWLLEVVRHN